MKIEHITTLAGFNALRDEWSRLFIKMESNSVFIDFDWMRIWLECQGEGKKIRVFVVREGDEVIGIAPMMLRPFEKSGFQYFDLFLMTAYDDPFSEKGVAGGIDLLWDPEHEDLKLPFARYILQETSDWCYLRLHPVPEDSSTVLAFRAAARELEIKVNTPHALKNVCLNITQDWDSYFAARSSNLRKSLRRGQRDLEKLHTLQFIEYRTPNEVKQGIEHILEIEKHSWKAQRGFDISSDELNRFYFDIADYYSQSKQTMIWVMMADTIPIAYELHLEYKGYVRTLKGSYDDRFKKYSPGNLLIAASCEAFFQRGLKQVDMMWGSLDYKQKWSQDMEAHVGVYLRRNGFFASFIDKLHSSPKIDRARKSYRRFRKRVLGKRK